MGVGLGGCRPHDALDLLLEGVTVEHVDGVDDLLDVVNGDVRVQQFLDAALVLAEVDSLGVAELDRPAERGEELGVLEVAALLVFGRRLVVVLRRERELECPHERGQPLVERVAAFLVGEVPLHLLDVGCVLDAVEHVPEVGVTLAQLVDLLPDALQAASDVGVCVAAERAVARECLVELCRGRPSNRGRTRSPFPRGAG